MSEVDTRQAKRWYLKYNGDAYALGPLVFDDFVSVDTVVAAAKKQFGSLPDEVWPDGEVVE